MYTVGVCIDGIYSRAYCKQIATSFYFLRKNNFSQKDNPRKKNNFYIGRKNREFYLQDDNLRVFTIMKMLSKKLFKTTPADKIRNFK